MWYLSPEKQISYINPASAAPVNAVLPVIESLVVLVVLVIQLAILALKSNFLLMLLARTEFAMAVSQIKAVIFFAW